MERLYQSLFVLSDVSTAIHLALALDTNRIQLAGLIQPGWEKRVPNNGIVTRTVAAIVTRAGNPKHIVTWSDLAKPGVSAITADPKTSGIARWNFLAFWGSVTETGGTEAFAKVGFRPLDPAVTQEFSEKFPPVNQVFTVEAFGGWNAVQEKFFKNGGVFDHIQANLGAKRLRSAISE